MEDIKYVKPPYTWMYGNGLEVTYTYNHTMTLLENVYALYKKIMEITKSQNELINAMNGFLDWANNYIKDEVERVTLQKLQEMLDDGTMETLINETLFNTKLDKVDFQNYKDDTVTFDMNRLNLADNTFIGLILVDLLTKYDRIILPNNPMVLAGRINVNKPVTFMGGNLKQTGSDKYMFYVYDTRNVHFKGVTFNHNNIESTGIRFQEAIECSVRNCYFHDYKVNAIFAEHNSGAGCITTSNARQLIIKENRFERIGYTTEGSSTWESEGKSFLSNVIALNGDCTNSVVESNTFNTIMMGIFVSADNIKIVNNTFDVVRDNTIYAFGDRIFIEENDFKGNEDEIMVLQGGVYLIRNNNFTSAPVHAIGVSNNIQRLNIIDNKFERLGEFSKVIRFRDMSFKIVHLNFESNIINMNDDIYYGGPDKDLFTLGNVDIMNFTKNYIIVKVVTSGYRLVRLNGSAYQYINFNENLISYVGTQTELIEQLVPNSITYINFNLNKLINCYTSPYLKRGLLGQGAMSTGNIVTNVGSIIWSDSNNPPQAGYHMVGTLVINGVALNDGSGVKPVMWVCVRAGNPGTWKPITVTM